MTELPKVKWSEPLSNKEHTKEVVKINEIYKELPFKKADESVLVIGDINPQPERDLQIGADNIDKPIVRFYSNGVLIVGVDNHHSLLWRSFDVDRAIWRTMANFNSLGQNP